MGPVTVELLAERASELEAGESDYARFLRRCGALGDADEAAPLLQPGAWTMPLAELRVVTVEALPSSSTRAGLWGALVEYATQWRKVGIAKEMWVGGSFLTIKAEPDDIDVVVVLMPGDFIRTTRSQAGQELAPLLDQATLLRDRGLDVGFFFEGDMLWNLFSLGAFGFERDTATARGFAVVPLI